MTYRAAGAANRDLTLPAALPVINRIRFMVRRV